MVTFGHSNATDIRPALSGRIYGAYLRCSISLPIGTRDIVKNAADSSSMSVAPSLSQAAATFSSLNGTPEERDCRHPLGFANRDLCQLKKKCISKWRRDGSKTCRKKGRSAQHLKPAFLGEDPRARHDGGRLLSKRNSVRADVH